MSVRERGRSKKNPFCLVDFSGCFIRFLFSVASDLSKSLASLRIHYCRFHSVFGCLTVLEIQLKQMCLISKMNATEIKHFDILKAS